jgi:oligopeptide/dipeptide ABC transporter ATP-binding protein
MGRLLGIEDLIFGYPGQRQPAVDEVSLTVDEGKTLALVGESGSGKSTLGRCVLGLARPLSGSITFGGVRLDNASRATWRQIRPTLQIVFQDPHTSLNPLLKIGTIIADPIRSFHTVPRRLIKSRVAELLELVELAPQMGHYYPHQLSGGQRQRVAVARALASNPRLIVLDEPTSALDVSVGAKILKLLAEVQMKLGTAYLFISHDLATVRQVADDVAVMLSGKIVETGPTALILSNPQHPYTKALLAAVLPPETQQARSRSGLRLLPHILDQVSAGCRLAPRCPFAVEWCQQLPPLRDVDGRKVACWLAPIPEASVRDAIVLSARRRAADGA